ncbi:MAG: cell volume regulation protein A [Spirochaetes bacterium]|nr:MAG: cell volume regulation protein A [Spirochaetota bacterium]
MLFIGSMILIFLALSAAIFRRFNIPMIILALSIGIFFGSDVTGIVYFDNAALTQRIADLVLVFVLFAGGFSIKKNDLQPVAAPTLSLATLGVLGTALSTAFLFHLLAGWRFMDALLVSAIISSTDAAAVFSILRNTPLQRRVSAITEIESAANDPMAIISTTFLIGILAGGEVGAGRAVFQFLWSLAGGLLIGYGIGRLGSLVFRKIREVEEGYYYILIIGIALASYSLADLAGASGMLAAFFAGLVLGNAKIPHKSSIASFTGTLSFVANAGLFILLGLLVFPRSLLEIWPEGLLLFLLITFVGRPLSVFICTSVFKLKMEERAFLAWSGIRGSVPIVLATYPAAAGLDPGNRIFNMAFFAVTLSILVQGTSVGSVARFLRLTAKEKPRKTQKMELVTVHDTKYELAEVYVDPQLYEGEVYVSDIGLDQEATVTMVSRGERILAPRGNTALSPGDLVTILVEEHKIEEASRLILEKFHAKQIKIPKDLRDTALP